MLHLSRSLEVRLVAAVSFGLFVFSLIAGLATYTYSYRNQFALAASMQQQLVGTVQIQAEVAVFAPNREIALGVVEGLLANPLISAVRLEGNEGFRLALGHQADRDASLGRSYVLLSPVDRVEPIGTMVVFQNDGQVAGEARKQALYSVALMLLQIAISGVLMFFVLRVVVTRPVARLAATLANIRPGSKQRLHVAVRHVHDELGRLALSANALLDTAEKAIDEIQLQRDQMELMATHDALTGLPGMRLVTDRLQVAISGASRNQRKMALLFIDLDGFKAVNDGFGHDAGDAVLKEVAQRLRQTVRGEDTAARIGGDEFLVILSGLQDVGDVTTVAEKLIAAIGKPIAFSGADVQVGASIGIAVFPEHGNTVEALRQMADGAMYSVKKSGKNGYAFAERDTAPVPSE